MFKFNNQQIRFVKINNIPVHKIKVNGHVIHDDFVTLWAKLWVETSGRDLYIKASANAFRADNFPSAPQTVTINNTKYTAPFYGKTVASAWGVSNYTLNITLNLNVGTQSLSINCTAYTDNFGKWNSITGKSSAEDTFTYYDTQ